MEIIENVSEICFNMANSAKKAGRDPKDVELLAVTKTIRIDGQEVTFRASAAIPRLYRVKFHRDIYRDLDALQKAMEGSDEGASTLDTFSLELFENISYIMARHADPSVPDSPEEWLEQFNTFSIYQVLPQIIELWGLNLRTDVESKKNFVPQNGR